MHAIIMLMMYNVILVAAIALPVLLLMLLRAHAAIVFLSLCAGSLLVKYVGYDATTAANMFSSRDSNAFTAVILILVMLLPVLLSAFVLRRSVSGAKMIINIVPAAAVGVVGALLVVPLLPGGIQYNLTNTQIWIFMQQYENFIIGTGILLSLFIMWYSLRKPHHRRHSR